MLKIRLRRMGAIRQPHYRIVVADSRSPRDGRFIETLGHYNPLTDPATINIDLTKYEDWKRKGAQPTDAVASLVRQYNRLARRAEAGTAQPASRQTRTASRKGMAAPATEVAEVAEASEVAEGEVSETEVAEGPVSEAIVEATRDESEGSEVLTGEIEAEATEADVIGAEATEAAEESETAG